MIPIAGDSTPTSFVDLLRRRAQQAPARRAFLFLRDGEAEQGALTYAELDRRARAIGAALQAAHAGGARALLLIPPGLDYIAAFFGCLYAGVIAVPAYPPKHNRSMLRLQAVVADARATIALTTAQVRESIAPHLDAVPGLARLHWLAVDTIADDGAERWQECWPAAEGLAFLQYTSGSTAAPKGVMVSHANLLYHSGLIQERFGHTPASCMVSWLPPYHDLGLILGILQPLYAGFPAVLMSPFAFAQRPLRWLEAISRYRSTSSCAPNFAYDLCVSTTTPEQRAALDLACWEIALNGAEPVRHATLERFAAAFAGCGFRPEAMYPAYGLAEATLVVSGGERLARPLVRHFQTAALEQGRCVPADPAGPAASPLVGCGRTLGEQQIAIVDPETLTRCPPGRIGEIWVRGGSVAGGYWGRPEETGQTFGAHLAGEDTGGPFLRTGDLGFLQGQELFVAGRIKDLIIIRGRNVYPQDVELTVERAHPALRRGCGAAFAAEAQGEERLVVVQELERRQRRTDINAVAEAIRCAVAEEHELQVYAVALIKPASIPRTSSGKIQRRATRAAFLEGRLDLIGVSILEGVPLASDGLPDRDMAMELTRAALLAASPRERQSRLLAFLRAHTARLLGLRPAQIDPARPAPAFGLDSLLVTELCARIEQNLGVLVPVERVLGGESLDSLARFVLDQCAEAAEPAVSTPVARAPGLGEAGGLPLSFAQERMWYLDRLEPGSPAYTIPALLRLDGPLDTDALRHSLDALVQRHESLRTTFQMAGESLVQVVHPDLPPPLNMLDLRAYSDDEQAVQVGRALQAEVMRPFALDAGPLFRATLVYLREEAHLLLLALHHIVADGWSLGVLAHDLAALYDARRAGVLADLAPLPVQYADFALWQRQALRDEVIDRQVQFWTRKLAGAPPAFALPADLSGATGLAGRHRSVLPAALAEQVASFSRERGVTPFVTLLAALKLALFRWTGQGDIVIGSVVAGRQHTVTMPLVGCFINFLPLRSRLAGDMTVTALLDQVRTTVLEAHAHQDAPFERIVEALQPRRRGGRYPVYNVGFLEQGAIRPRTLRLRDGLDMRIEGLAETGAALLDLRFLVDETYCQDGVSFECEYDTGLFTAGTIARLADFYRTTLERLVQQPEERLAAFAPPEGLPASPPTTTEADRWLVTIAATFTAEPLEESLVFWFHILGLPATVVFAPYGQVFQHLLDPAAQQDGVTVLLVRFDDWLPAEQPDAPVQLERNVQEFIRAVRAAAARSVAPQLVCVCPPAIDTGVDAAVFERLEALIAGLAAEGITVITSPQIAAAYPVAQYADPYAEQLGQIPYTDLFFTALGTSIARALHALHSPPRKVLVLDCDQTLWSGVCAEDGALGVVIDAPRQALQRFAIAQHAAGMLICLCSKNDEQDVVAVFECRPEMPLKREQIIAWRINWRPKSENIRALADQLGLGLDSFVVLDDSPLDCAELRAACPEVLTLQLPADPQVIPAFLAHCWAFDRPRTTGEDRQRTALYRQQAERERYRQETLSLGDFLAGLGLHITIAAPEPTQLERVAQLTQRTNQFNLTTIRRAASEIRRQCESGALECAAVDVRDRFGTYGLVGVLLFAAAGDALVVDTFLLSCRALGRGVEHAMLAWLGAQAGRRGLARVELPYRPTARNQPALQFLESIRAECVRQDGTSVLFALPADVAAAAEYAPDALASSPTSERAEPDIRATGRPSAWALIERIATELDTPERILEQQRQMQPAPAERSGRFTAPRTPLETDLGALWAEMLGLARVGIDEDFFELGGHSLLLARLLARAHALYGVEIPLKALLDGSFTVAEMARIIEQQQLDLAGDVELDLLLAELDTLSDAEVAALLQSAQAHDG